MLRPEWTILPLSLTTLVIASGYLTARYECPFSKVELSDLDFARILSNDAPEIQELLPRALGYQERSAQPLTISDVSITRVYDEHPLHWWQASELRDMAKYGIMIGVEADPTLILLGVNKCGDVITREIDF